MISCGGCGTPAANAFITVEAKPSALPKCPMCDRGGSVEVIEHDRFFCRKCDAVFERPDTAYVDTRPENNAAKNGL